MPNSTVFLCILSWILLASGVYFYLMHINSWLFKMMTQNSDPVETRIKSAIVVIRVGAVMLILFDLPLWGYTSFEILKRIIRRD